MTGTAPGSRNERRSSSLTPGVRSIRSSIRSAPSSTAACRLRRICSIESPGIAAVCSGPPARSQLRSPSLPLPHRPQPKRNRCRQRLSKKSRGSRRKPPRLGRPAHRPSPNRPGRPGRCRLRRADGKRHLGRPRRRLRTNGRSRQRPDERGRKWAKPRSRQQIARRNRRRLRSRRRRRGSRGQNDLPA